MNILQILPKLEVGGVERGTVDLARHLAENGHKSVVVSGGGTLVKKLDAAGVRHYELPVGAKNPFIISLMVFNLAGIIKRENIDIVHARSRVPAIIAFFASRMTHRVFITTAHGQYRKHLSTRVMGWGKFVIVATHAMARHMKDNFSVPSERIRVIPRGVDLKAFAYEDPKNKRRLNFTVGMVSRITPIKGHFTFLKAVSRISRTVSKVKAVIAGSAPSEKDEYLANIKLLIRRLALQDKVEFLGLVEDVPRVLYGLDVLVSASQAQEAFGRSIIEAQACGVPVVATRVGGVTDVVEDGKTSLLCNPGDPKEMAEKILELYRDKELRASLSRSARSRVEKEFSLEKMLKSTIEVYEESLRKLNILIIKISALGDVILSIPSIRAIREKFPGAKIKVLTGVKAREALSGCPYADEVLVCDFDERDKSIGRFLKLAKQLAKENFDIVVDLQNNKKSHLLSYLTFAHKRYGYDNGKLSFLLNNKIKDLKPGIGPVEHQLKVLNLLGIYSIDESLRLWPSAGDRVWAKRFLEGNWARSKKPVAMNLESSPRWESKNWPIKNFIELSEGLARRFGIRTVLIGREAASPRTEEFLKKATSKPIVACGKTDIHRLAALLEACSLLITSDSAPMHVASSVGTPFIALFGPTDPARHLPPSGEYKVLKKDLPCSPCYSPRCNNGYRCMAGISTEEMLGKVAEMLNIDEHITAHKPS